jgi:hypothetical protein
MRGHPVFCGSNTTIRHQADLCPDLSRNNRSRLILQLLRRYLHDI